MIPDYALGGTYDFKFSTRAFATGAPTTLAGTPVVSAYVDNSTTELTAGITLTVDFDSRTGLHNVRVVATTGNGYADGSSYSLVVTTGTVGGVSVVGEVIGAFSLGRTAALKPTVVGRTLDVATTGEAGIDLNNTNGTLSAAQIASNAITAAKIAASALDGKGDWNIGKNGYSLTVAPLTAAQVNAEVDTALADYDGPTRAEATSDKDEILVEGGASWTTGAGGSSPTAAAIRAEIDANSTQLAAIVADTNELQTDDVPTLIANLDAVVDTVKAETALIVADTNELQSDDVPGLIAALDTVVDAVGANVDTMVAGIINGAAAAGTLSTTQATTNLTGYLDDQLIGRIITVLSGAAEGESSDITAYASTGGRLTFTAMTVAMSDTDTFKIT